MPATVTHIKKITFKGHVLTEESGGKISEENTGARTFMAGLTRIFSPVGAALNLVTLGSFKKEWKLSKTVHFQNRVCSVELKVLTDDTLHDAEKLAYEIDGKDVKVTATFSCSFGNPILAYDIVIEVKACILME